MRKISLNKKLLEISKLVEGEVVVDLGCDHAKLAIFLALEKNFKVYACDLREKALKNAKNNALQYGVYEKINFFLSDGFKNVNFKFNTAVLAGMGGRLIKKIILEEKEKLKEGVKLILQPQGFLYELKETLILNGFEIEKEVVVLEKNKFYNILVVKYLGKPKKPSFKEAVVGKLLEEKTEEKLKFLQYEKEKTKSVLKALSCAKIKNNSKIKRFEELYEILKEADV